MLIISHRGNTSGAFSPFENKPEHIKSVLKDYDCEVDVWYHNGFYYLGHDFANYIVDKKFLKHKRLWCHAKHLQSLEQMLVDNIKCFFHQNDDYTLTSNGYIWTFPCKPVSKNSIIVDTSKDWKNKNYDCYGVCVDYII
jgi:hypothetical protein